MTLPVARVERANRTRRSVLRRSKSGVFALFGSKQELQLATVREASRIFVTEVLEPVAEAAEGLARLRGLCEGWLRYSEERVFPGGCFFYGVTAEFDAREGAVHDALVEAQRAWLAELERCAAQARVRGELDADTDPAQLAFEVVALMETANAMSVLHGEAAPYVRARRGIAARLGSSGAGRAPPGRGKRKRGRKLVARSFV